MKLPREQVEWVAKLAQIELTEEEKSHFATDLSNAITYIDELSAVDVTGVNADNNQITGLTNNTEVDEIRRCEISKEEFLNRAPAHQGDYILVKKVLDK